MKNKVIAKAILIFFGVAFFYACSEEGEFKIWKSKETVIGIQPFGDVKQGEIDSVQTAIANMYSLRVEVLEPIPLPKEAYTEIRYPRYRADTLVQWLSENKPDSVDIVVGLTNKDISITKYKDAARTKIKDPTWQYRDFGIYGLGRIGGSSCVVSSNRLRKNGTEKQFFVRLCRIACHEVGHVLGLKHCPEKACLMNDANEKISTIDNSTGTLCEKCWSKID